MEIILEISRVVEDGSFETVGAVKPSFLCGQSDGSDHYYYCGDLDGGVESELMFDGFFKSVGEGVGRGQFVFRVAGEKALGVTGFFTSDIPLSVGCKLESHVGWLTIHVFC